TLAGNGASYLVVAQFAGDQVPDAFVLYRFVSGTAISASLSPPRFSASAFVRPVGARAPFGPSSSLSPGAYQCAFTRALRARARQKVTSGAWRASILQPSRNVAPRTDVIAAPAVGTTRGFSVLKDENAGTFANVTARLAYAGNSVLVYIDTFAAANGFSS